MDFSESETDKTEAEKKCSQYYILRLEKLVKTRQQRIQQLEVLCRKLAGASSLLCRRANTIRIADDERKRRRFATALIDTEFALADVRKAGIK